MISDDRMKAALVAIVRAVIPELKFLGTFSYLVTRCSGGTFDGTPEVSSWGLPPAKNWPVRPSVIGGIAVLPAGSSVAVQFINGDRARPFIIAFSSDAPPTSVAEEATATWTLDAPLVTINGGAQGVARLGDTVQAGPYSGVITSASTTVLCG